MKNLLFESSNYYHVFNRGNNRENIFKCHDNYIYFLKLVEKYLYPICTIYCYCLMPNHFHLLIKVKDRGHLPEKFHSGQSALHQPFSNLFNAYAKAINKRYNRIGSLFQKALKKKKIEDETYLKKLIIYVHKNPSHHSFGDYKNYKYSSFTKICSNLENFNSNSEMVRLFGDLENFKSAHELLT